MSHHQRIDDIELQSVSCSHSNSFRRPSPVRARVSDHNAGSPTSLHAQTGESSLEAQAPQTPVFRRNVSSMRNEIAWKRFQEQSNHLKLLVKQLTTVRIGLSSSFALWIKDNLPCPPPTIPDKAGQCCFICFNKSGRKPFAVQIPCLRPTEHRIVSWGYPDKEGKILKTYSRRQERDDPKDKAVECDADIYQRIREMVLSLYGDWTAWLPFYGVIDVNEVEVSQASKLCRGER